MSFNWFKLKALIVGETFICLSTSLFAQTKSFKFCYPPGNIALSALGGVNLSSTNKNVISFQSNSALSVDTAYVWSSATFFTLLSLVWLTFMWQSGVLFANIGK